MVQLQDLDYVINMISTSNIKILYLKYIGKEQKVDLGNNGERFTSINNTRSFEPASFHLKVTNFFFSILS